jgi:hypothetical protein
MPASAPPPPQWTNEPAVARLVNEKLEEIELEEERRVRDRYGDVVAGTTMRDMEEDIVEGADGGEQRAVAAARRGDLEPLARLLRPISILDFGVEDDLNPAIKRLSPATWTLISEFLTGERNIRTGRLKGEPGRPKMSREARRARNPVHDAADEVDMIVGILRQFYPWQEREQVRERAAEIAQARANIATSVGNLRRRSRRRHRA